MTISVFGEGHRVIEVELVDGDVRFVLGTEAITLNPPAVRLLMDEVARDPGLRAEMAQAWERSALHDTRP